jgi:hypothetical protein
MPLRESGCKIPVSCPIGAIALIPNEDFMNKSQSLELTRKPAMTLWCCHNTKKPS